MRLSGQEYVFMEVFSSFGPIVGLYIISPKSFAELLKQIFFWYASQFYAPFLKK